MATLEQETISPTFSNLGSCVGCMGEVDTYMRSEIQLELPKLICADVHLTSPIRRSSASPGPRKTSPVETNADSMVRERGTASRTQSNAPNGTDEASHTHPPPPPPCRRRIVCDFEKNLTFTPKLNMQSVKLASRNAQSTVPVVCRLLKERKTTQAYKDHNLTFAPKLNALSVRLAQERASRMPEVRERLAQLAAARSAEAYAQYTFKPHVSEQSLLIAEGLKTSFLARQQEHIERRQRVMDEAYKSPTRRLSRRSRRIARLTNRTPPPPTTEDTPTTHMPPCSRTTQITPSSSPQANAPSSPDPAPSRSPTKHSHSTMPLHGTRLSPQSSSSQSLKGTGPPRKHQRRKSAPVSNTKSPVEAGGKEQLKVVPSCARVGVRFEDLSEGDRVKRVRVLAERAVRSKKIFRCIGGYKTICKCLRERGWVEQEHTKPPPSSHPSESPTKAHSPRRVRPRECHRQTSCDGVTDSSSDDDDDDDDADLVDRRSEEEYSDEEEYCMLSRAVRNCAPNFVWTLRRDDVLYRNMHKDAFANHFAKASSFTTKVGLCTNLRNLRWYGDSDPDTFYPRCYRLSCDEEKEAFVEDYRFTAALNILKHLVESYNAQPSSTQTPPSTSQTNLDTPVSHHADTSRPPSRVTSATPTKATPTKITVPEEAVRLALKACEAYLSSREHNDIEESQLQLCPELLDSEWDELIRHFYSLIFGNGELACINQFVGRAISILDEMGRYFPQLHMDGVHNIWIVKPGALSRGRGIMCKDRLEDILELVSSNVQKKENKWVVQKYIERPLLVYKTKFDIRQWFLVTDWNPLTMWMYKECYLRFSTQQFTLDNLDASVHLCNNSIQKYYENSSARSDLLPEENMWDSDTFKQYLNSHGRGDEWDTVIYPGMKQALINALQVTQDEIEHRKNSFELYGADFMISEDFKPWLIEINCSPTMESSTAVTARMCREVMEDTIKVVVDRRENKNCDTGKFELAYQQPKLDTPAYVGIRLCVCGSAISKLGRHKRANTVTMPVTRLEYQST